MPEAAQQDLDFSRPAARALVKPRQVDRVLAWLREHGSMTEDDAKKHLGIRRLGARIWDLRRLGHTIETEMVPVPNRWDETCHVAKYVLGGEHQGKGRHALRSKG